MIREKITLFEIPIYSSSKFAFKKKWQKFFNDIANKYNYTAEEKDKMIQHYKDYYGYKLNWKFNQIIGYVQINLLYNDVYFNLFLDSKGKHFYNSEKKSFLKDITPNGFHFYLDKNITNEHIVKEIVEQLNLIKRYELNTNWFLDTTQFDLIGNRIDYLNLIKEKSE